MNDVRPGGTAPVLSANVPEPTTYSGRNFIDLALEPADFKSSEFFVPGPAPLPAPPRPLPNWMPGDCRRSGGPSGSPPTPASATGWPSSTRRRSPTRWAAGKELGIYRLLSGAMSYKFLDVDVATAPAAAGVPGVCGLRRHEGHPGR